MRLMRFDQSFLIIQNMFLCSVAFHGLQILSFKLEDDNKSITVKNGLDTKFDSTATLNDKNVSNALFLLRIQTHNSSSNYKQAYVGGYSEGYITSDLIQMHYVNVLKVLEHDCDENLTNCRWGSWFIQYAEKQIQYLEMEIASNKDSSFWIATEQILTYLHGMHDGYSIKQPSHPINFTEFYLLNGQTDCAELGWINSSERYWKDLMAGKFDRCSAAIRLLDDNSDLFFSHDAWTSFYDAFIRIAKVYEFSWDMGNDNIKQKVSFSSYPGNFFSLDDFYLTRSEEKSGKISSLAVLETTVNTYNTSLFDNLDPEGRCVMMWMRVQIANMLAFVPGEWAEIFNNHTSYTYNNEYLILDYLKFNESKKSCKDCSPKEWREYIIKENISLLQNYVSFPGYNMTWDATFTLLDEGYYFSVNRPRNESMERIANYSDYFNSTARYCMFQRDLPKVQNFTQFQALMRQNDYKHDACSFENPHNAIASRKDLAAMEGFHLRGAVDSKATYFDLAIKQEFLMIVGPPTGGPSELPPFNFKDHLDERDQPLGVRDSYDFKDWVLVQFQYSNSNLAIQIAFGIIGGLVIVAGVVAVFFVLKKQKVAKAGFTELEN